MGQMPVGFGVRLADLSVEIAPPSLVWDWRRGTPLRAPPSLPTCVRQVRLPSLV